jgi:molecular chaperone GrpE (heat shock protein)
MDKEQIKAYLCSAIDALSEQELSYFVLPTHEPDMATLANELTVLSGEVKKMNSVSLKLNNDMQSVLNNLNTTKQIEIPKNEFSDELKDILQSLIQLTEFVERAKENTSELPVEGISEFINFYNDWKNIGITVSKNVLKENKPKQSIFSFLNLSSQSETIKKKDKDIEKLVLLVSKMINISKSIDINQIQKLSVNYQIWKDGYEMFNKQWTKFNKSIGLIQEGKTGQEFNPLWHEAVAISTNSDFAGNIITETIEMGYLYKGDLIRRAKVVVNKF